MNYSLRSRAIRLRKLGWSYNVISRRLGVAKSTLSHWLREVPYEPNESVKRSIREGPARAAYRNHQRKLAAILRAKEFAAREIGELTKRDLWMLGLGIYIGEGAKLYESIRIINSDPQVVGLAIKWFRDMCDLRDGNFSIAVHCYPDTSIAEALKFWSKITGLPSNRFGKTQIDKRTNKSNKKRRKLPYGTVHITIKSLGNPYHGVLLHRRIMGWIEAAYQQLRV